VSMSSGHELHLLTGAYAVDALTAAETDAFERHARRCPACAEEARGLREAAARLAMATAIAPPPAMRARVLAAAARTRQAAPPSRRSGAASAQPARRLIGAARHRPVISAALTAMAAAIIVLVVLAGLTRHQLQQADARNGAVAAVLAAPDARLVTARTTVGGTVTVVMALREHRAVITARGMPSLSGSRVYQLWVMSPGHARSAGLLTAGRTGSTAPVLAAGVTAGDSIGITIEPAGGTSQPTTTPIAVMPVTA